jgi:uncharacterized protein
MGSDPVRTGRRGLVTAGLSALLGMSFGARAQSPAARDDLLRAVKRDDPHAVRTALLRGADANAADENGEPVLVLAARNKSWAAVRALAELRGTRLDVANGSGSTAMMYASLHGELGLVEFLVGRKAEVNRPGWTPLHFAAANGHVDVIRFLLEHHAYIDAESPNGTTPLMMAARQSHPTAAQLLLDEGADPTPRNQAGLDAAAYAKAAGHAALSQDLVKRAVVFRQKYGTPAPSR